MTKAPKPAERRLEIIYRDPFDLKADPRNARTHSPEQIEQLRASIREFGFTNPVLMRPNGMIGAGHGRVEAAKAEKLTLVPTCVVEGLTDDQWRAYVLADNKLALNAGWDDDILRAEIEALGEGFDLDLLGFDGDELDALLNPPTVAEAEESPPPEPPSDPVTRAGDTWLLGHHRVACGDCRNPDHVAALTNDRQINIAFTSPPYAEQRDYDPSSGFRPIPPIDYVAWFEPVAANVANHLAPDGSWFVNIKPPGVGLDTDLYVFDLVIAHVRSWGWHFATEFCWERAGVPKGVTQRFKNQFEPVYQFARGRWKMRPDAVRHESDNVPTAGGPGSGNTTWKTEQGGKGNGAGSVSGSFGGAKKKRSRGTSQLMSDIQGQNKDAGEYIGPGLAYPGNRLPTFNSSHTALGHTAAFPVGLPEFFINAYTDRGDVAFDPFCGSGSTIIAAENTGRVGLGMEISPAYVDVIVRRWQEFTDRTATLEATGQTFQEVQDERRRQAAA